jgi:hypothetical protein
MLLSTSVGFFHYTNRKASRELNSNNLLNESLKLGVAMLRVFQLSKGNA